MQFENGVSDDAMPKSVEAEQALIGAVLFDNSAFLEVDPLVTDTQFSEPMHQRLWKSVGNLIRKDRKAEPAILNTILGADPAFKDFGGFQYLMDLMDKAPPSSQVRHFAMVVADTATRAEVIRIAKEIAHTARTDGEVTGMDLLSQMESQLIGLRGNRSEIKLVSFGEAARQVLYSLENPDSDNDLLPTGLAKIDKLIGGLEPGDLLVLGGRPSMGKSGLALTIGMAVARQGYSVSEINGEMNVQQMTRRHLTELAFEKYGSAAPTYSAIKKKLVSAEQRKMLAEAMYEHEALPLFMAIRSGITLSKLRGLILRQKLQAERAGKPLKLIIIDHVGLVKADRQMRSRLDEQTEISGTLKQMARELGVAIIALAQLNREVEKRDDKRPGLSDLRDSGSWEQDADIVMGVYRDAYYAAREQEPKNDMKAAEWALRCASKEVEAIALKIREGEVGTARLWASMGHNAFLDSAPDTLGNLF